ncbi:hypothetical protein [Paraburkholderia sp. ZP32-5]|uniref:hypothetical protein n=1 Tax=Paraburkholderia sp. ZP32-5 TaxID=2883245 RepID=UPI001F40ACFE|nr:hypothetical protein [Paraburkholderia sp. ZP32-5]
MTVTELIAALGRLPADARVVLPHFHGGFVDVVSVHPEPVRRTVAETMADAAYEGADPLAEAPFAPDETAIVIDSE